MVAIAHNTDHTELIVYADRDITDCAHQLASFVLGHWQYNICANSRLYVDARQKMFGDDAPVFNEDDIRLYWENGTHQLHRLQADGRSIRLRFRRVLTEQEQQQLIAAAKAFPGPLGAAIDEQVQVTHVEMVSVQTTRQETVLVVS